MSSSLHSWLRKSTCLEGSSFTAESSTTVGVANGESDLVVPVDSVPDSSPKAGKDGGTPALSSRRPNEDASS